MSLHCLHWFCSPNQAVHLKQPGSLMIQVDVKEKAIPFTLVKGMFLLINIFTNIIKAGLSRLLFFNKHLCPMIAVCFKTDADMGEIFTQYICFMTGTVHPCLHNFFWCTLTLSDIFPGAFVFDSKISHHVKRRSIGWTRMGKIIVFFHIFSFNLGYFT